ncbi:MAG: hypothetical protein RLY31_633 [Bacteroidota bacterium]|jgi:4-hydroxy-tetrahydrodipicolinate synthase
MNQPSPCKGAGVALVTPFRNGKVDFEALARLLEHVLLGGVDFIVSLGSTGESVMLTSAECKDVFRFTLRQVNHRVPVVAGLFGANSTTHLLERLQAYDLEGFAAIMSSNPSYVKPSQEGIFRHYLQLERHSPLPIILYNVPGRTSSSILAETTIRLAEASPRFIAIKDASGSLEQSMRILKHAPDGFLVFAGDDALTLPLLAAGGHGAISVIANAFPRHFSRLVHAAIAADLPVARSLHHDLLDFHPWLYAEGNPPGIKALLHLLGRCENELRLPLTPVGENTLAGLRRLLEQYPSLW